jgi:hypothetical protein
MEYTATLTQIAPSVGTINGLQYYIMKNLATIGIVILRFHRPSFRQLKYVRVVDIVFDFTEETYHDKFYRHRQRFELDRDKTEYRAKYAYSCIRIMQDFDKAKTAYFTLDKPNRDLFVKSVPKPLKIVHIDAEDPSVLDNTDKYWILKLVS